MSDSQAKQGMVIAGCGGLIALFSLLGVVGLALAPIITDGRSSFDEVAGGIGSSCCCTLFGVGIFVAGLMFRKKALGGGGAGAGFAASNLAPGSLAWEAQMSLDPLQKTIAARQQERASAQDPNRAAQLDQEIAFLTNQVQRMQALIASGSAAPGRGYVGFDAFGSNDNSWG